MKKLLALLLAALMVFSLAACGGANKEKNRISKDEMLNLATPMTRENLDKSIGNIAYAKSLTENIYTFNGIIKSVKENYAVAVFDINDSEGVYSTALDVLVADLYFSTEDLLSLEINQKLSFVGKLDDVNTSIQNGYYGDELEVIEMIFNNAEVVSDRFEKTGKLDSKNTSFGNNSWNIKFTNSSFLGLVYFRDDVSSYKGKEITYSYKMIDNKCLDAYIVE